MTDDDRDDDVPRTVHDAMFKSVFSDPLLAADELCAVLPPALVASIDWPALTPAPASFVDAVFRQRSADLVFQSRFRGGGAGRDHATVRGGSEWSRPAPRAAPATATGRTARPAAAR